MASNLVDVEVILKHETPGDNGAYKVESMIGDDPPVWVPKSICEIAENHGKGTHTLTLPRYIAIDKGLV